MKPEHFEKRLAALLPELIAFRRDLHAHPEIGFQEHRTAAKIAAWLGKLPGMQIRTGVAGTGVVATLGADRPGPCLAFRADMDALPMEDKCGKPHQSTITGAAHACGHDGHVACLLGAATLMAEAPGQLPGPVRFLFQPAEEGGGGAKIMMEQGALENPRSVAIFGLHGWPQLPVGTVGLRSGPIMASTDAINITVHGRGAHAAYPNRGIDPIVAAAHVVTALQAVVSRLKDPTEPAVVTIGTFHAGTARNVIPDTARLEGTLRTLSEQQRIASRAAIRQVAEQTAAAFGARAEVEIEEGYPVNVNDPGLKAFVQKVAIATLGSARVTDDLPVSMGGEDFAYFVQQVPGCFMRLGVAPADGSPGVASLHNAAFDFNDEAIATGVTLHCAVAWSWAERGQ
jgi:amidohydrolase